MTYALVALACLLASLLVPAGLWLHAEVSEGKNLRDSLDQEQRLSFEYQHERDLKVAELKIATDQLDTERSLRAIAEAQRNSAEKKVRAYLARTLAGASEKEITDATAEIFATPLSLAPGSELERP